MGVLETTYKSAIEKPLQLLEIFNEHFGEDKVDMQGYPSLAEVEKALSDNPSVDQVKHFISSWQATKNTSWFILVHFPHVRITNEYNRSVDIHHLYAKVAFDIDGKICGRFSLNRSDYSLLHLQNNYMHSHVSGIPLNRLNQFQQPCTGSGPINNTICTLSRDFDEDLWKLFCLELERYVHVESIAGTPYHRLEDLSPRGARYSTIGNDFHYRNQFPIVGHPEYIVQFAQFTKYLVDNGKLSFHYENGQFKLAKSPTKAIIEISNLFIEWYNKFFNEHHSATYQELLRNCVLLNCKYTGGQLRQAVGRGGMSANYEVYDGMEMFKFKGQPVLFTISDRTATVHENEVVVLNPAYVEYILTKILNVINFRYGSERNEENSAREAVCFL